MTIRPRTIVLGVLAGLGFFVALTYGNVGRAAEVPSQQPAPCCITAPEWYVNSDETALKPTQQPFGLLFDGPSLIHHAVTPVALADAPTDGAFGGHLFHGSMPLFKMETTAPYSTINKTAGGKFWSSKIASGDGSQSMPLDTIAALVGKWNYTADTKVYSFGVGYANDSGNQALVSWISFGGHKYGLACPKPSPSPSASSPSPSVSPSTSPSVTPTTPSPQPTTPSPDATTPAVPTTEPPTPGVTDTTPGVIPAGAGGIGTGGQLAKTGYDTAWLFGGGATLIALGVVLAVVAARRRRNFVA